MLRKYVYFEIKMEENDALRWSKGTDTGYKPGYFHW